MTPPPHEPPPRPGAHRRVVARDRGAALILAVAVVVMIGTIVAGLTAAVTSGLDNRSILEEIRDRQYAADGAIERAIAASRAEADVGGLTCGVPASTTSSGNGIDIHVDREVLCGVVVGAEGLPVTQLDAVFTACEDTGSACDADAVVVRALVAFEVGSSGSVTHVSVHSWSVDR